MKITGANGTALGAYENARYRAVNMMCELDSGGEWYIEDGIFLCRYAGSFAKMYIFRIKETDFENKRRSMILYLRISVLKTAWVRR